MSSKKIRKKIIDQAIKNLAKGGLRATTMKAIAKELRVEDAVIAEYFSSKEEILVAQQERLWKGQFSKMSKILKKAKTPADHKEAFEVFFDNLVFRTLLFRPRFMGLLDVFVNFFDFLLVEIISTLNKSSLRTWNIK